jgi:hypothetical protein
VIVAHGIKGNICEGDSGGPLYGPDMAVLGVVHGGNPAPGQPTCETLIEFRFASVVNNWEFIQSALRRKGESQCNY